MHKDDIYQNHFFADGVISALIVTWASNTDLRGGLVDFLPWMVLVSPLLSAGFHRMVGRRRERTLVQCGVEEKEKLPF